MDFLTWGQNPWAQAIPIRISWDLLYAAAAAGALFIIAHAVHVHVFPQAPASSPETGAGQAAIEATLPERIDRHSRAARLFHWVMAAAMFVLLITAPSPHPLKSQLIAKQYNRPAPPVATRFGWLQPRLGCDEFHELLPPPCLSEWPSCAEPLPSAPLV